MLKVSNADRVVFPAIGRTKGDVVAYYARIAERALPHVRDRPLSIRRYPKGLAAAGFFQKNVPAHYPASITRFAIARSHDATKKHPGAEQDVTLYPLLSSAEHLPYLANQGAIELHVPTARAGDAMLPDRFILDLDPPAREVDAARRAAYVVRDALAAHGLRSVPIATGSKGYHVVAAIVPNASSETLAVAAHQLATMLAAAHADALTVTYRVAQRGGRVFLDWPRNNPGATVVAPYSLRASERATVAVPLSWDELDQTRSDQFSLTNLEELLGRPDPLLTLAAAPGDTSRFVASVADAFARSGLELAHFDRFRS